MTIKSSITSRNQSSVNYLKIYEILKEGGFRLVGHPLRVSTKALSWFKGNLVPIEGFQTRDLRVANISQCVARVYFELISRYSKRQIWMKFEPLFLTKKYIPSPVRGEYLSTSKHTLPLVQERERRLGLNKGAELRRRLGVHCVISSSLSLMFSYFVFDIVFFHERPYTFSRLWIYTTKFVCFLIPWFPSICIELFSSLFSIFSNLYCLELHLEFRLLNWEIYDLNSIIKENN